jgi:hypothetical protein
MSEQISPTPTLPAPQPPTKRVPRGRASEPPRPLPVQPRPATLRDVLALFDQCTVLAKQIRAELAGH